MSKVKLDYWIARDADGELNIGSTRPRLDSGKKWWVNWGDFMELPRGLFRDVTVHNSPQKAELTIEIKNYGKEEGA